MVFKIMLTLSETEAAGLARIAANDVRTPREQIRYLLRRELIQAGMLPSDLGTGAARGLPHITEEN